MRSFPVFLIVILSLYGLLHAYAYLAIHRNVSWSRTWRFVLIIVFACFFIAPVAGRTLASRGGSELSALILRGGYEWMAALFLFVAAQACLDALRGVLFLLRRFFPGGLAPPRPGRKAFYLASAVALAAFAYSHVEARFIQVDQLDLCSPKLASGVDHLRVVQVSDLHFSAVNGTALAGRVAEHIQALRPDLIVATGDMVDRGMRDPEAIARILGGMEARLGKFAVTGNHEFYHDLDESLRFLKRSGFRVLRGEAARPAPWLTLMGVDDEAAYRFSGPEGKSVEALLEDAPEEDLVILLRHRPLIDERAGGRIDLQLSGHTHGGQIFPFSLVVAQVFPFLKGTHTLDGGTVLHVNRGTGTWGPPVRFLSPPEITAIDIRRP